MNKIMALRWHLDCNPHLIVIMQPTVEQNS